jgi:hypothetical protein
MKITDEERAKRLCRTIITDIVLYNTAKVEDGIKEDNIFEVLEEEIEQGKKLFLEKVDTDVIKPKVFDRILIDVLIAKYGSKIESSIW